MSSFTPLSLRALLVLNLLMIVTRADTVTVHDSPFTNAQIDAIVNPTTVSTADQNKGLIPTDPAVRYKDFTARVGTWLSTDPCIWWNFDLKNRAEMQDAFWNIAEVFNKVPFTFTGDVSQYNAGPSTLNQEWRDAAYRYINLNRYLYSGKNVRYLSERTDLLPLVQAAAMVQLINLPTYGAPLHVIDPTWKGYSDMAYQGSLYGVLIANDPPNYPLSAMLINYFSYAYMEHRCTLLHPFATYASIGRVSGTITYQSGFTNKAYATALITDVPKGDDYPVIERDPINAASFFPYAGYIPCTLIENILNEQYVVMASVEFPQKNGAIVKNTPKITVKRGGKDVTVLSQRWGADNIPRQQNTLFYSYYMGFGTTADASYPYSKDQYGDDETFDITIDGIQFTGNTASVGGSDQWMDPAALQPRSVSYSYTVFNPNRIKAVSPNTPSVVQGLSTRATIGQNEKMLIAGIQITGTEPVRVMLRAQGPSLASWGVGSPAHDTAMQFYQILSDGSRVSVGSNDNWQSSANWRMVQSFGFNPGDPSESAMIATLPPGWYSAVVSDNNSAGGVGLVEVYAVDPNSASQLNAVSTRGLMGQGEQAMMAGIALQKDTLVVVRMKGPSMAALGVANTVSDPTLKIVRYSDKVVIATNDDWAEAASATLNARLKTDLSAYAPTDPKESALLIKLPAGAYSIVGESKSGVGVGMAEIYRVE